MAPMDPPLDPPLIGAYIQAESRHEETEFYTCIVVHETSTVHGLGSQQRQSAKKPRVLEIIMASGMFWG